MLSSQHDPANPSGFLKLINTELARLSQIRPQDAKMGTLWKAVGCSKNVPLQWKTGHSFPSAENAKKMASFFYGDDKGGAEDFLERLNQARSASGIRTIQELKDHRSLRLGYLEYPPFCRFREGLSSKASGGFLDELWVRLLNLSQFTPEPTRRDGVTNAVAELLQDNCDVALALFDTIDRSLDIHCFHSACRISLNALTLERDPKKVKELCTALTIGADPALRQHVRPAALRNEVGYCYLRDSLGFAKSSIREVAVLSPDSFAEALLATKDNKQTDVIVADEFNILTTIQALQRLSKRPTIVFPLATEKSIRSNRRRLPTYLVGLASVSRRQIHLVEYLDKVLKLLLQTDIELISELYFRLYGDVQRVVHESLTGLDDEGLHHLQSIQDEPCLDPDKWIDACAIRVARYTLRLSDDEGASAFEELNLPWQHILHRVRNRIGPPPEGTEYRSDGKFSLAYRAYEPFCVRPSSIPPEDISQLGFMGQLLKPFEQFIHLDGARPIDESSDLLDRPENSWPDVRIGLFETLQRTKRWRYFCIPSRIPLNALILDTDFQSQLGRVRDCFRLSTANHRNRDGVHPIVLRAGSGYEYLLHTLGFEEQDLHVLRKLDASEYASELMQGDDLRPIVVDFLTCLRVMNERSLAGRGRLVYPLPTAEGPDAMLAEYALGIAVNRDSKVWTAYFEDALPLLLRINEEWVCQCYTALYEKLRYFLQSNLDELHRRCPRAFESVCTEKGVKNGARKITAKAEWWARYCLYLTESPLPQQHQAWAAILTKVRKQIAPTVGALVANTGKISSSTSKKSHSR